MGHNVASQTISLLISLLPPLDIAMKMVKISVWYNDFESDRISLALLFSITQNFGINVEYSHTEIDTNLGDGDTDEFYVEGLVSF